MTARVWRKGPPPSVGWWPASRGQLPHVFRWWNGSWWSELATPSTTAEDAERAAAMKSDQQEDIEWTDRPADWPARSLT